jgi:hypothetical protein
MVASTIITMVRLQYAVGFVRRIGMTGGGFVILGEMCHGVLATLCRSVTITARDNAL